MLEMNPQGRSNVYKNAENIFRQLSGAGTAYPSGAPEFTPVF